ncbi:hypothetical protein HPOKI422_04685 [Helicobacter pylori oki422]|nr:hypothetical protein HPOKI422_04685 [Helicobacter pylori oki422]
MKLSLLRGFFEAFLFSFFELSFLRGFDLFLFVDPHCFRFLIFSFLTFLIPLYRLRYNELILYF